MIGNKKQLGQFFTKNSDYILGGLDKYVKNKRVIDPFAGSGDLIKWAKKNKAKSVKGYDIDDKYVNNRTITLNDSINSRLKYDFVLTNPPYLNINKASKNIKEKYFKNFSFEDLYQISLSSILDSKEGIVIVPLNFLCAENSKKIRDLFFDKFEIVELNIFSEQVFEDTTYNVISFYYRKKEDNLGRSKISAIIFPENKKIIFNIERKNNWQFGGDFINRIKNTKNHLRIFRLTEDYLKSGEYEVELAFQNIKYRRSEEHTSELQSH